MCRKYCNQISTGSKMNNMRQLLGKTMVLDARQYPRPKVKAVRDSSPSKHLPSLYGETSSIQSDALSRNATRFYTTYVTNCWSNLLTLSKAALKNTVRERYARPLLSSSAVCLVVVVFLRFLL